MKNKMPSTIINDIISYCKWQRTCRSNFPLAYAWPAFRVLLFRVHAVIVLNAKLFAYDRGNTRLNCNSFCYTTNLFFYSFVLNYLFRPKGIQTFSSTGKSSGLMRWSVVYSTFQKHVVYTSNAHFGGILNYTNIFG